MCQQWWDLNGIQCYESSPNIYFDLLSVWLEREWKRLWSDFAFQDLEENLLLSLQVEGIFSKGTRNCVSEINLYIVYSMYISHGRLNCNKGSLLDIICLWWIFWISRCRIFWRILVAIGPVVVLIVMFTIASVWVAPAHLMTVIIFVKLSLFTYPCSKAMVLALLVSWHKVIGVSWRVR